MARKGRLDRGLMQKRDASGKIVWFVRLYHEGKERRFGTFSTKTAARDFYEKAKQEQKAGRFFPERYQHGGYKLVEAAIDWHLLTIATKKQMTQVAEQFTGHSWKGYYHDKRLNAITVGTLEEVRLMCVLVIQAQPTLRRKLTLIAHRPPSAPPLLGHIPWRATAEADCWSRLSKIRGIYCLSRAKQVFCIA